jgi:tetrahydromethanopterin S-methyltransferase subunit B
MSLIKIKENDQLKRDTRTGAVLNVNEESFRNLQLMRANAHKIDALESRVNDLTKKLEKLLKLTQENK